MDNEFLVGVKFLVVVKDDLNIVRNQRLCNTREEARIAKGYFEFKWDPDNSDYTVEVQMLHDKIENYKVVVLKDI